MKVYEIPGDPVAWCSHRGFGKKSFNPHYKEKEVAQWHLKQQHKGPLIDYAVRVDFYFEMPIPKNFPKGKIKEIKNGKIIWHDKRKDRTNLIKFAEDCMTGIILKDDNIVCSGESKKYYAIDKPRTVICVWD